MKMSEKKKILHLFNAFEVGGVERQHMLLVRELTNNFHQSCWSYNHGPIETELDEFGIAHRVGRFSAAIEMLERNKYDCVILRTNRYMREMGNYFSKKNIPVIYIRSYLRWMEGNETYFDPELETISYQISDYCFFSGPSLMAAALTLPMEIPGRELLYNGLDLERFPLRVQSIKTIRENLRIGVLANLVPHKNQHIAIEVLREKLQSDRCSLVLGGATQSKDYEKKIKNTASGLPVKINGYVEDVVKFFSDLDVFMLTSKIEGWPISVMEAMACGVPVIVPDVGDMNALLENGDAGLIYPKGQYKKIPELIEEIRKPEKYEYYSEKGIKRVSKLDIKQAAKRLESAIYQVLSE